MCLCSTSAWVATIANGFSREFRGLYFYALLIIIPPLVLCSRLSFVVSRTIRSHFTEDFWLCLHKRSLVHSPKYKACNTIYFHRAHRLSYKSCHNCFLITLVHFNRSRHFITVKFKVFLQYKECAPEYSCLLHDHQSLLVFRAL
jgi:hypothetical protein